MRRPASSWPATAVLSEAAETAAIVSALTHVVANGRGGATAVPLPAPSMVVPRQPWTAAMGCHRGNVGPAASHGGPSASVTIVSGTSVYSPCAAQITKRMLM